MSFRGFDPVPVEFLGVVGFADLTQSRNNINNMGRISPDFFIRLDAGRPVRYEGSKDSSLGCVPLEFPEGGIAGIGPA